MLFQPKRPLYKKSKTPICSICSQLLGYPPYYHNIAFVQEQLMQAINILGLLVEYAPDKQITIAAQTFNTQEIAVTTLNLISLEQQLNTINNQLNIMQQNSEC